jgi:hypothetical protein
MVFRGKLGVFVRRDTANNDASLFDTPADTPPPPQHGDPIATLRNGNMSMSLPGYCKMVHIPLSIDRSPLRDLVCVHWLDNQARALERWLCLVPTNGQLPSFHTGTTCCTLHKQN